LAHTPSLISTVLSYVEAGSGVGIISDSIISLGAGRPLVFRPLTPAHTVDLVMVWSDDNDSPSAKAFRDLVFEWQQAKRLWNETPVRRKRN
jgi:DNA-binding transcriptional LysR family regulator